MSELLKRFQSLIFHVCRDELREHEVALPDTEIKQLTEMDVVIPAAAGSFKVLLESAKPRDLLGVNHALVSTLRTVDKLFFSIAGANEPPMQSAKLRGSLHKLDELLQFLNRNDTSLNYAWAEPKFETPRSRRMSAKQIRSYIATRKNISEPPTENVQNMTLFGEVERVNRKMKTWGLYTDDGSILKGVVDEDGHQLNGLTVGEQYEFVCLKIMAEGDAEAKYVMKSYKPL